MRLPFFFALPMIFSACTSLSPAPDSRQNLVGLRSPSEAPTECLANKNVKAVEDMPLDHHVDKGPTFKYFYEHSTVDPAATTIVFLPGGPGSGSIGRRFLPAQVNSVLVDPRGVGCNFGTQSQFHGDTILSDQVARDVAVIIERLKLKNYIVYGQSYGTMVATMLSQALSELQITPPKAVILEGVIGSAYPSWEAWNSAHIVQANRFLHENPQVQALFHDSSRLPLGYPAEFWGHKLFYVGHLWQSHVATFTGLAQGNAKIRRRLQSDYQAWQKESKRESVTDWIYNTVVCRELSPSFAPDAQIPILANGRLKMVGVNEIKNADRCAGFRFDHPYDSSRYQIQSPLIYFQGDADPVTPIEGAQYHYDQQKAVVPKKLIRVTHGGHNPLQDNLADCKDKILQQIVRGDFEFGSLLTESGACAARQAPF